jgi:hypothetical protein
LRSSINWAISARDICGQPAVINNTGDDHDTHWSATLLIRERQHSSVPGQQGTTTHHLCQKCLTTVLAPRLISGDIDGSYEDEPARSWIPSHMRKD